MKTVYKPWGKEEWLELNDRYCYKRIYINAGYKTSYQYHEFKRETNFIISGEAEVWLENDEGAVEKKIMKAGEYFNVTPPKKHRVIALTDIILQEVSTPEVDDVIRIEDDANRASGRLEGEHQTPGVLIVAAGKGTRLKTLTEHVNKGLLPINNEAIISKIIKNFPSNYKFVIAVGYKGKLVEDYCKIVFPTYDFTFVYVDDIESNISGPGYSALQCKEYLQRPFYFTTVDCLLTSKLPNLDSNWLGLHQTSYPEKYSTALLVDGKVEDFTNKNPQGYEYAFTGLAGILDYTVFWDKLTNSLQDGEIVSAFYNPEEYGVLNGKIIEWFDTGNYDDLEKARLYFNDKPLSLSKKTGDITFKDRGKLVKFISSEETCNNLFTRGTTLNTLVPPNLGKRGNFIYYDWVEGDTLYTIDEFGSYVRFIESYLQNIKPIESNLQDLHTFYNTKTEERVELFNNRFDNKYLTEQFNINGIKYSSFNTIYKTLKKDTLFDTTFNENFHGDLQFDNIVFDQGRYYYIDWRESFGESLKSGDVYYDLAKLYGGIRIPYNLMKSEDSINLIEGEFSVEYTYSTLEGLDLIEQEFEFLVEKYGYDFNKIKFITGLIYLNMSPLHDDKFSKLLWFEAISILSKYVD